MKSRFLLFVFAALVCVMPAARAADLTGVWKGTFNFNDHDVPTTLNLKMSGGDVTGTVEGLGTSPTDIHEGKVVGDLMSFWVNTDYQGDTYKLIFKGQVKGEQIDFAFGTEDGSWGTNLSVKRDAGPGSVPASAPASVPGSTPAGSAPAGSAPAPAAAPAPASMDVTGTWKGEWEMNGTTLPSIFVLKSTGGVVTGAMMTGANTSTEIHDGKIEGDTITFWVNTEYQGQTYILQYKGKITAGQINFDFGLPDGSWGAQVTLKKS